AYDEVTEAALRGAKAVVVLWSKKSVVSRWVRAEATLADRNKTLVPAMIEPCDRPIMFELTQTADLSHWQGAVGDPTWRAFLSDVRRFVERDRSSADDHRALEGAAAPRSSGVASPAAAAATSVAPVAASAAWVSPTTLAASGARGDAPSLAVLPFTNRSGLPEDEVFAIGMVEDVIDALSRGAYVRVLASAATARFRTGALPDLEAMSRLLGVRYLLEGNVRRAAANLRVTAQLLDAATGAILWTQRFERSLAELAALQEELVVEVATHLGAQVHRIEMERALKKPGDLTAWEALMRAIAALRLLKVANMAACAEEAQRAVTIAPDYGLAHAVLAMASALHYGATTPEDAGRVGRIRDHIDRALQLDPDSPLVLAYVSLALSWIGYPDDAWRHADRAVRLNSSAAMVHLGAGVACLYLNRPDEALAHLDADIKASPGAPFNSLNFDYQSCAHILAARWPEAIAACDHALASYPDNALALVSKATILQMNGRTAEASSLLLHARRAETAGTLAVWEMNFNRIFHLSAVRQELVRHLRAVWAQSDSAA
ncbi:MAG: TIR domain-containing protein, partial [Steroidobacteraceae bacterium]